MFRLLGKGFDGSWLVIFTERAIRYLIRILPILIRYYFFGRSGARLVDQGDGQYGFTLSKHCVLLRGRATSPVEVFYTLLPGWAANLVEARCAFATSGRNVTRFRNAGR